ncbi:MAG TPA: TetR/AcrR family transcriptional regulator [Candidatus Limnocylindrales bacterium]
MAVATGRRGGRPARISRDVVLRAAVDIADRDGLDALTMRSIGQRVGVEAMSLYRHVNDKEDVLDGIVDLVFSEIETPGSGSWKAGLDRHARSTHDALARHPWAVALMESRAGPASMRHHDAVLGCLRSGGFSVFAAVRAYNIVNSYVYGFALQELSLPFRTPEEQSTVSADILQRYAPGEYPNLEAVATGLPDSGFVYAEEFGVGLGLVIGALERLSKTGEG